MAGTREGGLKAKAKIQAKLGKDYYTEIGKKGGQTSKNTGFGYIGIGQDGLTGRERAALAGKKSKKGKSRQGQTT